MKERLSVVLQIIGYHAALIAAGLAVILLVGCASAPHIVETMADNGCALKSYSEKGKAVKIECHANADR